MTWTRAAELATIATVIVGLMLWIVDLRKDVAQVSNIDSKLEANNKAISDVRAALEERAKYGEKIDKSIEDRFRGVETSLKILQANVAAMCAQPANQRWNCKPSAVVTAAQSISNLQAGAIASAMLTVEGPAPAVSPTIKTWFADLGPSPIGPKILGREDIAKTITWTSAARNVQWSVKDKQLFAKFENGSVLFMPKQGVTQAELLQAAADMNSISQAVVQTLKDEKSTP